MLHLAEVVDSVVRNLEKSKNASHYWLGVDGGGTNTRAKIYFAPLDPAIDLENYLVGEGRSDAANFHRVGLESSAASVKSAITDACLNAKISITQLAGACIGLAGVSHPDNHKKMSDAIKAAMPQFEFELVTDARVALAGATAGKPGVVVIAGTGSIAYGVDAHGNVARAGGWGPALGDEGSGTYIGRRALEAVMTAYDHRTHEDTKLTEKVCRHFHVNSPVELPTVIYDPASNAMQEIAQLSKEVVEAANEGDETAIAILKNAAHELARAVIAVIEQLKMKDEAFRVGYVGGVFSSGELMLAPLRAEIMEFAPHALIGAPLHSPMIGAAQMAMGNVMSSLNRK